MTDAETEIADLRSRLAAAEREASWQRQEAEAARRDEMQALRTIKAYQQDLEDAEAAVKFAPANARMLLIADMAKFLHDQLLDDHKRPVAMEHTRVARGHRADARKAFTEACRALERAVCANNPGAGA